MLSEAWVEGQPKAGQWWMMSASDRRPTSKRMSYTWKKEKKQRGSSQRNINIIYTLLKGAWCDWWSNQTCTEGVAGWSTDPQPLPASGRAHYNWSITERHLAVHGKHDEVRSTDLHGRRMRFGFRPMTPRWLICRSVEMEKNAKNQRWRGWGRIFRRYRLLCNGRTSTDVTDEPIRAIFTLIRVKNVQCFLCIARIFCSASVCMVFHLYRMELVHTFEAFSGYWYTVRHGKNTITTRFSRFVSK